MAKKEKLFDLIKSLSKSEKRYFKLHSSFHSSGKPNNYALLFDYIEKQKSYDEAAVIKHFEKEKFVKHFAVFKNRLFDAILSSLRSFHAGQSAENQVIELLQSAEVLHKKQLGKEALNYIAKAKKLAKTHDLYSLTLYAIYQEGIISSIYSDSGRVTKELQEEHLAEAEVLKNAVLYRHLTYDTFSLTNKTEYPRSSEQEQPFMDLMNNPLLKEEGLALSGSAKENFNVANSFLAAAVGDHEKAYGHRLRQAELFLSQDMKISRRPFYLLNVMGNLAFAALNTYRFDAAKVIIQKIKALADGEDKHFTEPSINFFTRVIYYFADLQRCYNAGLFEEGMKTVTVVEEEREVLEKNIIDEFKVIVSFNAAYVCLGAGEYKRGLSFANIVINETSAGVKESLQISIRLMRLIFHFELGNTDLLPYLVKSTYRFIYKQNQLYGFEKAILKFIKDTPPVTQKSELMEAFQKVRETLVKLLEDPYEKNVLANFNYTAWLDSKLQNRPFAEIVKEEADRNEIDTDDAKKSFEEIIGL